MPVLSQREITRLAFIGSALIFAGAAIALYVAAQNYQRGQTLPRVVE